MRATVGLIVGLFAAVPSVAPSSASVQQCSYQDEDYERVLDAYFAQARGSTGNAIVLRVYGGLAPEYEIVLRPDIQSLVRYSPKQSIWAHAYDSPLVGNCKSVAEYIGKAIEIPVGKGDRQISESRLAQLFSEAKLIDTSVCERLPLKDSKGHEQLIEDAPWFEVIENGGRVRARVTGTHDFKYVMSQNAPLLKWALDVQTAFKTSQ